MKDEISEPETTQDTPTIKIKVKIPAAPANATRTLPKAMPLLISITPPATKNSPLNPRKESITEGQNANSNALHSSFCAAKEKREKQ